MSRTVIVVSDRAGRRKVVADFEERPDRCGFAGICGGCTGCLISQALYNGFRVFVVELEPFETPGDALGRIGA